MLYIIYVKMKNRFTLQVLKCAAQRSGKVRNDSEGWQHRVKSSSWMRMSGRICVASFLLSSRRIKQQERRINSGTQYADF